MVGDARSGSVPGCDEQPFKEHHGAMDPEPILPETTNDERDPADSGSDEWRDAARDPDDLERFLRDKPPHHG